MLKTRNDVIVYAKKICISMLEVAAERRLSHRPCEVVDTIGYVPSQMEELFRPFWGIAPILRDCEKLFVIEHGKVAEEGTHKELMSLKGRYYELFTTQAKRYIESEE